MIKKEAHDAYFTFEWCGISYKILIALSLRHTQKMQQKMLPSPRIKKAAESRLPARESAPSISVMFWKQQRRRMRTRGRKRRKRVVRQIIMYTATEMWVRFLRENFFQNVFIPDIFFFFCMPVCALRPHRHRNGGLVFFLQLNIAWRCADAGESGPPLRSACCTLLLLLLLSGCERLSAQRPPVFSRGLSFIEEVFRKGEKEKRKSQICEGSCPWKWCIIALFNWKTKKTYSREFWLHVHFSLHSAGYLNQGTNANIFCWVSALE